MMVDVLVDRGYVCGIITEQVPIRQMQQKLNSYVHSTVPVVQSGMTNVVPLLLRTASERRNEIFCASEREFPEFPEIPSGITNLVPRFKALVCCCFFVPKGASDRQ